VPVFSVLTIGKTVSIGYNKLITLMIQHNPQLIMLAR
jgi:hypothetical protein